MELERFMFQFAEKSNKQEKSNLCWSIITYTSLTLALIFTCFFLYGEFAVKTNVRLLENCLQNYPNVLQYDSLILVYSDESVNIKNLSKNESPIVISSSCNIFKNANYSKVTQEPEFIFTGAYMIYKMDQKELVDLKFDNYTLVLKNYGWFDKYVYGIPSVAGNEMVRLADEYKLKDVIGFDEFYFRSDATRFSYSSEVQLGITFWSKMKGILIIGIAYGIVSIATSLYVYITIMCSPAMIMLFMKAIPCGRTDMFFELLKSFPWVGMHSLILRSSNREEVKEEYISICSSLFFYFFVIYMGYYTAILEVTNVFFDLPVESSVGELLFGYLTIVEFATLVFMRTRPFMKYFPKINTFMMFIFMLYCRFGHFGFKLIAVLGVICYSISLFGYMMIRLEIPAVTNWDNTQDYVPNIKQPRAGLMPCFNLNWINGMPEEWSMLIPLVGREYFEKKELSFVDQEYEELNDYLNE